MTAAVRPDSWDFPLLVHVVGSMVLVGALVLAVSALILAWRDGNPELARLGYRSLLLGVLPGWLVMRVGAEWIASKEDIPGDPGWLGVGYITSDGGAVLLIAGLITAGIAQKRAGRGEAASGLTRAATILSLVLVAALLVALWAMSTKPAFE